MQALAGTAFPPETLHENCSCSHGARKAVLKSKRNTVESQISIKMAKGKALQSKSAGGLQESLANVRTVAWKLVKSTGKAGWITATTCLVLLVPLIIEMDREQQLVEFENQQLGALTGGSSGSK